MQIHLHTLKSSRCTGKPKLVKLLRRAILSLFCFLCLFLTWKSDATKLNTNGTRVLWPGRLSCQQTKSVQGEEFDPCEMHPLVYCETYIEINLSNYVLKIRNEHLWVNKSAFIWFICQTSRYCSNMGITCSALNTETIQVVLHWTEMSITACVLHLQPISVYHNFKNPPPSARAKWNKWKWAGNCSCAGPAVRNINSFTTRREKGHFAKVGVIWHCGGAVGWVAESDIESDTAPGPGKVTIGLMGKRAVMRSHGGKLSHSLSQM